MTDLYDILKSNSTKEKAENERLARLTQFKGIRANERNKVLYELEKEIDAYNDYIPLKDLKQIIEKLRKGEA